MGDIFVTGPFEFDAASGLLRRGGDETHLPLRSAKVLEVFLRRPGEVLSKDEILNTVWEGAFVGEDSLTQAISQLRQALGDDPQRPTYIQTIPKRGYRFIGEVSEAPDISAGPARGKEAPADAEDARPSVAMTAEVVPFWRRAIPWALVAVMVIVSTVVVLWALGRPAPTPAPLRIPVDLPPGLELRGTWYDGVAVSPDGGRLVFVARPGEDTKRLYAMEVDRLEEAAEIPGTEDAQHPFFSPDGQWVGFFQNRYLKKVSLRGGDPVTLYEGVDAGYPTGADWGPDDTILFSPTYNTGIWQISADGEGLREVTTPDLAQGEIEHDWPSFLPGGQEALFTSYKGNMSRAEIVRVSLETGAKNLVHAGGYYPRYLPGGNLVFGQGRSIFAAPYDLDTGEVTGAPEVVLDQVRTSVIEGRPLLAFSDTGVLAFVSGGPAVTDNTLVLVDREGSVQRRLEHEAGSVWRFSPDGERVLTWLGRDDLDIWIHDLERGGSDRLTTDPAWDNYPVVSKDGKVAFASEREGEGWDIFWIPMDRSEPVRPLVINEHQSVPGSWSPDGKLLAYHQSNPETGFDIWILDLDDPDNPKRFIASEFNERFPAFSPDGRLLAYASDESGDDELYAVPYPEGVPSRAVSIDGARRQTLRWAPAGNEIFYLPPAREEFLVVSVETEPGLSVGVPRLLFRTGAMSPERVDANLYDVHPDGELFIMRTTDDPEPLRLHVWFDWFEELRRLMSDGD